MWTSSAVQELGRPGVYYQISRTDAFRVRIPANSRFRDARETRYIGSAGMQLFESVVMTKTSTGNFFEDFRLGQTIRHATPRTMSAGDAALYTGLFGPRFAVQSSDVFAKA